MRNRQAIRRLSQRAALVRAVMLLGQVVAVVVAGYYTVELLIVVSQLSSRIL